MATCVCGDDAEAECGFCGAPLCLKDAGVYLVKAVCIRPSDHCISERIRFRIARGDMCSHCGSNAMVREGRSVRCSVCGQVTFPAEYTKQTVSTSD